MSVPVRSSMRRLWRCRMWLPLMGSLGLTACERAGARWTGEPTEVAVPVRTVVGAEVLPDDQQPADAAACRGSARVVRDRQGIETAVWWRQVDSTRVHLVAARRDQLVGGVMVWGTVLLVDTLDRGPRDAQEVERGAFGCARPAPSVAVDSTTGYLHVAYALAGPEGTGIFYAHQMDPRAAFEVPIAILYGDRLGAAHVAADGNVVAVAYEDPNSRQATRVGVAISRTAGHLFDTRLAASVGTRDCRDPQVTVRGAAVTVGWSMRATADAAPAFWQRQALVQLP